jgi:catechol-2,3-dioxygenase
MPELDGGASPIDPGVDIGHVHLKVSEIERALDFADPDGNGIELYWDRPRDRWPQPQEGQKVEMYTRPLDVEALLAEAVAA